MVYNIYKVKKSEDEGREKMKPYNPENGRVTANIPLDVKKVLMHKAIDESLSLSKYIAKKLTELADGEQK